MISSPRASTRSATCCGSSLPRSATERSRSSRRPAPPAKPSSRPPADGPSTPSTPTVIPASGTTAPVTGAVNFAVNFSGGPADQTVSFEEVLKPGWNLVPQGGLNAACTTQGLTAPRASPNAGSTGFSVTVGPNDIVSCLVRNEQPTLPRLTLVKQVANDNGGTAIPTAWTLNAAGPTPLSGPTGSTAVTNQIVGAGTYNLSETGGPPPGTYAASSWSCTGATSFTATSVTLRSRRRCDVHDRQQRHPGPAHARQDGREQLRRDCVADRLDTERGRSDRHRRRDRQRRGHQRGGQRGHLHRLRVERTLRIYVGRVVVQHESALAVPHRRTTDALARGVGDVHAHELRRGRATHAGETGHQQQRGHRLAVRVDAHRGRPRDPRGNDRYSRRDERDRADRDVRPVGDGPAGLRRVGVGVYGCDAVDRDQRDDRHRPVGDVHDHQRRHPGTAHALEGRRERQRRHRGRGPTGP